MASYAIIKNGVVINVITSDYPNAHKIKNMNGAQDAICVDEFKVQVGDSWDGTDFIRGEVKITRELTVDQKDQILGVEVTELQLENIILGQQITDLELRIIALEEQHV